MVCWRRGLAAIGCAITLTATNGYAASETAGSVIAPPPAAEPHTAGEVTFSQRHPPGSVGSVETAERALADAKAARLVQEQQFVTNRQDCYGLLVAEPCLRRAIEDNARTERQIRAVEVEARAFKRSQAEREAAAARSAKRSRDSAADAGKPAGQMGTPGEQQQRIDRNAAALREFEAGAGERARRAERERKRLEARQAARLKKAAEQRAGAAERAQQARAHEDKVKQVLERAQEKEERARKNAAAAAGK